jgi:hypothetical protein
MRNAELVVKYLEGPASPISEIQYAGVFVPFKEVDGAFAMAEPPTHDDWSPEELVPGHDKTFVKVALRRIKEAVRDFAAPQALPAAEALRAPLGSFADFLGSLVSGLDGTGPAAPNGEGSAGGGGNGGERAGAGRPAKAHIRQTGPPTLTIATGIPLLVFPVEVRHARGSLGSLVTAVPIVGVLDGSTVESDPPAGVKKPSVVGWRRPSSDLEISNPIAISQSREGTWEVLVEAQRDAAVGVEFVAQTIES